MSDESFLPLLDVVSVLTFALSVTFLIRHARLGNLIIVLQYAVVFMFSVFTVSILNAFDYVLYETTFDFSVFSRGNVQLVLALNSVALSVTVFIYSCMPSLYSVTGMFQHLRKGGGNVSVRVRVGFWNWMVVSWILIVGIFVFTPNVLQFPYPENNMQPGNIPPTIRALVVLVPYAMFLGSLFAEGFRNTGRTIEARLTYYCAVYFIGLMGGARGAVAGLLISTVMIDIFFGRDKGVQKWGWIAFGLAFLCFAVVNWPYMRVEMPADGWYRAFVDSFERYAELLPRRSIDAGGVALGEIPMLGQSLFHFLYVIDLVDSGAEYGFRTFINLVPQQLPDILDGILWTRPENDAVVLMDYFIHGGGFYSLANAYWNQGFAVMLAFAGALAWLLGRVESYFKDTADTYVLAYMTFLYLVPVNMYYGIQGLVRGLEYGVIAVILLRPMFDRESQARTEARAA